MTHLAVELELFERRVGQEVGELLAELSRFLLQLLIADVVLLQDSIPQLARAWLEGQRSQEAVAQRP